MILKKRHLILAGLLMICSLALFACSSPKETEETKEIEETTNNEEYSDSVVQVPEPVVENQPFSMLKTNFDVDELSYCKLDTYISNHPGDIKWVSEDPSIALVVDDTLIGVYQGYTTITGTSGDTSVTLSVHVNSSYLTELDINTEKITLFEGEEFKLIATKKNAIFSSADSSTATVSDTGVIKGVKPGTTTISVKHNGAEVKCEVEVVANDGTYLDIKSDKNYTILEERTFMSSERIYLFLDAGTQVDDNIMEQLEEILDEIERVTGYSFTEPANGVKLSEKEKITINVMNKKFDAAYASGTQYVVVAPYDIAFEQYGAHVLVHELLHLIQMRNGVSLGATLSEGYAEYLQGEVCKNLPYQRTFDEVYNQSMNMGQFEEITIDNIEQNLLYPVDVHPLSYFFVEYIAKTYGDEKLKQLADAIAGKAVEENSAVDAGTCVLEDEDILEIIKANTSANLMQDFGRYYTERKVNEYNSSIDLREYEEYMVEYAGNNIIESFSINGSIIYDGSIVLDYTEAIDYAAKIWGRKCKALYIYPDYYSSQSYKLTGYDSNGKEVKLTEKQLEYVSALTGKGVVKVKIEGDGIIQWYLLGTEMF